jgi:transcriptional regulator with XRE-family HTH domain
MKRMPSIPKGGDDGRPRGGISEQQRKEFGLCLRAARDKAGITQSQLSEMTGVQQKHISKIEHGKINVTLDTMTILAKALDLDVRVLLAQPPIRDRDR